MAEKSGETDEQLDVTPLVDPVLERERQKEEEKKRERKLSNPSIDELPPPGLRPGELSETDPTGRSRSWQDAVSPEDAAEERMKETIRVKESGGQD